MSYLGRFLHWTIHYGQEFALLLEQYPPYLFLQIGNTYLLFLQIERICTRQAGVLAGEVEQEELGVVGPILIAPILPDHVHGARQYLQDSPLFCRLCRKNQNVLMLSR